MSINLREPVNGLTHFFAALAALIGLIIMLVIVRDSFNKTLALTVYGLSLVLLFSASSVYHLVKAEPKVMEILRKFDHSAIYLLVAGTYTPFCMIMFTGFWKWGLLTMIWSLALIGIGVKIYIIKAPRWLNAVIYLVMGWLSMAAIEEMLATLPMWSLTWLVIGGVIYTLGALVYITKFMNFWPGKFGFHEVWHIFVILGAMAHFIAIFFFIAP
ncbi:MAG: hemolysin III family protein [Anaerolineae bacterium]|nr:hemolysin III family protein [Anaerolineae bacterium]MDK1081774.1 hemolysin III family protein [Anaerolineae bacterium]MDK1118946.1 hemolysin III family protein [Anaerolineae bacterium]